MAGSGARPNPPAAKKAAPAGKAAPRPQERDDKPPAAPAKPAKRSVHRAGGWIDRGDGRGWELEE